MSNEVTLCGDYLGTIEEYVPGKGTYVEDGKIYAAIIGKPNLDKEKHIASVEGKQPADLKIGDVIYGEVVAMRKNIVTVIAYLIQGNKTKVDIKTGLFVSNIADKYIERPEDMFSLGDLVKGKVVKIEPGLIDISTKGGLGVVRAYCNRCRHILPKGNPGPTTIECTRCGLRQTRHVAEDYGRVEDM
ncbi:Exosome complex component Csl4 [uncultured archaeon]|nr:Exosome complex component Csl4 [uncultured archaeon]